MAMAVTVPVINGTIEMDGHRPDFDVVGPGSRRGIAQMRVTQPQWQDDDGKIHDESIVELTLTRGQIHDIIDMMGLYR